MHNDTEHFTDLDKHNLVKFLYAVADPWASAGEGKRGPFLTHPLASQNSMFFDFFHVKIVLSLNNLIFSISNPAR